MSSTPSTVISQTLRSALVAVVRKRVPESEVEDIVQATLTDAIGSPHAPAEAEAFRRWIFGIAKHKVVDYHRRAGRETFEVPDVPGTAAPHVEADLLRWAEKNLPPGDESQTTLDWMLREGEGEKLESIAETERVPAPRVRQRVSRLRRHLKAHWQKELALVVAATVVGLLFLLARRNPEVEPIAKDGVERAEELRKLGFEKCRAAEWVQCVDKLDAAQKLDPAGDSRPEVQQARDAARKALTPAPTENVTPPPAPTSSTESWLNPAPEPSGRSIDAKTAKTVSAKQAQVKPAPMSTDAVSKVPMPKANPFELKSDSSDVAPTKPDQGTDVKKATPVPMGKSLARPASPFESK